MPEGIGLISPDGSQRRVVARRPFGAIGSALGWSADSMKLYLLEGSASDYSDYVPYRLSAIDVQSGAERVIGEYPAARVSYSELNNFCARLSLSRDGKRLLA